MRCPNIKRIDSAVYLYILNNTYNKEYVTAEDHALVELNELITVFFPIDKSKLYLTQITVLYYYIAYYYIAYYNVY
jgi:hypothetical protein